MSSQHSSEFDPLKLQQLVQNKNVALIDEDGKSTQGRIGVDLLAKDPTGAGRTAVRQIEERAGPQPQARQQAKKPEPEQSYPTADRERSDGKIGVRGEPGRLIGHCPICGNGVLCDTILTAKSKNEMAQFIKMETHRKGRIDQTICEGSEQLVNARLELTPYTRKKLGLEPKESSEPVKEPTSS